MPPPWRGQPGDHFAPTVGSKYENPVVLRRCREEFVPRAGSCLSLASGLEATDVVQFETLRPSVPAARARGLQGTPAVSFRWREFCPVLSPSQSLLGGFLRQGQLRSSNLFRSHDAPRRAT